VLLARALPCSLCKQLCASAATQHWDVPTYAQRIAGARFLFVLFSVDGSSLQEIDFPEAFSALSQV